MSQSGPRKAARSDSTLKRLRAICLALPNTRETLSWGSPHFRVGDKIFCGIGDEKGRVAIGFKLQMDHADALIQDPRFWRAPFVGRYGWVSMGVTQRMNWGTVKAFVEESYRLIAPKEKRRPSGGAKPSARAARRRKQKTA